MMGGANISASGLDFVDVEEHWAKAEIENWTEKGIINGYKDGTFKPNDNITRAEFITLINKVINMQGEEEISFEDINGGEWYYSELKKAIYGEYIGGYEDNTFRANDNITRQEVAVILQNLVQLKSNEESELEKFTDTEDIPTWSRAALNLAVQKGYLTGYTDKSLKASNYITRAESVMVLSNVFGTIYNEPGVYGPGLDEEVLQVKGNVTVSVEDVTLQNMTIDGDLYLVEGIGEGDVILDSITVKGDTIVKGGGENSIIIKNSSLENLLVIKKYGKIRIVAQGSTSIGKTYLYSSAKLQGERLNKESFGDLEIIRVTPGEKIELEGSFTKIDVKVPSEIQVNGKSKVEEINVHENTEEVSIFVSAYSIIDKIYVYTEIKVDNRGIITEALGDFAKTSIYENRLPLNLQPKTSSSSRPSVDKYTLTLNSNIDNGGSLSGSGSYEADTNITISAIAYEGYEFIEWKEGEDQITTAASFGYTTTDEDKTFTAYFESTSEFEGGSGTESDPYLVANADQLDKVRDYLDAHFKQVANIDLGVSPWNDGEGWEPIGGWLDGLSGSYDGNGYMIENLTIDYEGYSMYQSLFQELESGGLIENVILKNVDITGNSMVGALVAYQRSGEIRNCSVEGTVRAKNNVGGLVAQSEGLIFGSFSEGLLQAIEINGNNYYFGGLVGRTAGSSEIYNSYSTSEVSGDNTVGGLVGNAWGNSINNCYSTGKVSGIDNLGGLIGKKSDTMDVNYSYWDTETSGLGTSAGGTGYPTSAMIKSTNSVQIYVDWDFNTIWEIETGVSYPYLRNNEQIPHPVPIPIG
jgi:hypothetical protein